MSYELSATIFPMLMELERCGETNIHRESAGGNYMCKVRSEVVVIVRKVAGVSLENKGKFNSNCE